MRHFLDRRKYCKDTFLLPQSWNSFRQTQPFISLFLLLCLCHILWAINAKAHCGDTNAYIFSLHTCATVHIDTHMYMFPYSLISCTFCCVFPSTPCGDVQTVYILFDETSTVRPSPRHDALAHLWDACIWERAAPFNRCCIPHEGVRTIKNSH